MTPDMQKELLARLDALAAKLGVTADALWQIYLSQAHIEGIQNIISGSIALGISIGLSVFGYKLIKKGLEDNYDDFEFLCGGSIVCVVSLLVFFGAVAFGYSAYTELANPGFWAFCALAGAIK
jgi:hypothetical protein